MLKPIDIERLLQWAYCDELPKQRHTLEKGSWDRVSEYGERGGMAIDDGCQLPGMLGGPHPDADVVAAAVDQLGECVVLPHWADERARIMPDALGLAPVDDRFIGAGVFKRSLVITRAKLRNRPECWCDVVGTPSPAIGRNGKPIVTLPDVDGRPRWSGGYGEPEIRGVTPKGDYLPNACCAVLWEPRGDAIAFDRVEYVVWHRALGELVEILRAGGKLVAWSPTGPEAPAEPWNRAHAAPTARVWQGTAPSTLAPIVRRVRRGVR